jgi:hypothetical protein
MKLYADLPARRVVQISADVVVLVWIVLWAVLGHAVYDATLQLAQPGHTVASASTGLADQLEETGHAIDELPVVGSAVAEPLQRAGGAAGQLADAGRAQVRAVERLAGWLGWSVALIPILGRCCCTCRRGSGSCAGPRQDGP